MPNRRGTIIEPGNLEQAHPFPRGRFAAAESQDDRGTPGSRDRGEAIPSRPRSSGPKHSAKAEGPAAWSGVNPLPPIDPAMPLLKPGDQAG
jgi:hypothetical protein